MSILGTAIPQISQHKLNILRTPPPHLSGPDEHVDPERRGGPRRVLYRRADLGLVLVLAVPHAEHVYGVGGHLLLSDQNLTR